tara:strand:- start:428 stop:682 length:255 start_codon:yes stop_codon:yes gene_type:complete
MVKYNLQKGLEKLIKSVIIENFHGEERQEDEKLDDAINSEEWVEDGVNDEHEELTKRNWPFFIGILVFYITFLVLISFTLSSSN